MKKLHLLALALIMALTSVLLTAAPVRAESKPRVIINVYALNMRTGPGAFYASIIKLSGGSEFPIIGQNKNASWLLIETGAGKGWINRYYVITRDWDRNAPVVESTSTDFAGTVSAGSGALRATPKLDGEKIGSYVRRTEVTIIGQSEDGGWWLVKVGTQQGWMSKAVIRTSREANKTPVVKA
ncbi:MAG: SH3 domain-containing protein [Anaerolineae bacterium]|nr:SH3 domain-containing protein [Anaerolineae bacterium]